METTSRRNIRLHMMDQIWYDPSSEPTYSRSFVLLDECSFVKEDAVKIMYL